MSSSLSSREEKVGAKRKKTTNIKYFRRPFRPEHYRKHHYNQHPNKWKQYQLLTEAECKTLFDDRSLHRSSMHLYLNENQAPLVIEVDRAIVEGIIDSFLVGDDVDDISWDRIRSRLCCNVDNTHYVLNIVNPVQFHLIVDYLSIGMSFRMALATLTKTRHRTGLASLGSCTPELPAKYAGFACMINLQKLNSLMAAEWTFAIALDMSTHLSVSYLDIRVRLYFNGRLLNFHLLAIPINK
ncbi:ABC transporter C family member 5 [Phytophthora cinnamomi]|uniref:ABC transporter C family member 5 n=1 Tax=Phytophthora cinnamomi TaxID=4785 RepID=UPI003559BD58|nr:ABC transporter C family member 5 [Phytophthora cinnamomi]